MLNWFGRGFGRRGGMGFGFRGSSPPWPYVGRGRGGLPRCGYFLAGPGRAGGAPQYVGMGRDEELEVLRDEAKATREWLEQMEARIKELGKESES